MIVLFTDFGWNGPYVGQMKIVLSQHASALPVIDLMHDAPHCNPRASAYLLNSLIDRIPTGSVTIGVVDPGVGSERKSIIIEADGRWFVGPDNGLFNLIIRQANQVTISEILWRPENLSTSFHGRDLFAPIAAEIVSKNKAISNTDAYEINIDDKQWPDDLYEIIYIDNFGNLITGITSHTLADTEVLIFKNKQIRFAETFYQVEKGEFFWYRNSQGLIEIAINQGAAQQIFSAQIGDYLTKLE